MLWGPTTAGRNVVSPCTVQDLSLIENENQDTVSLLEKCVDVDKRGTRLPEAKKVLRGIYRGDEMAEVHGRSQEVG
jgi:hypothetical protein